MTTETIEESLKKLISAAVPRSKVQKVEPIKSFGLHKLYRAIVRDGVSILCSLSPPPSRRILRCEYTSIKSEAVIIHWLSSLRENKFYSGSPESSDDDIEDDKEQQNYMRAKAVTKYIPTLVEYGLSTAFKQLPYNLTYPSPGIAVAALSSPLTSAERRSVDFQLGQLLRAISLLRSPTSRFGTAESILPPVPERSNSSQRQNSIQNTVETFTKWSDAFGNLLNGAIQDAQASQITAAYDSIRRLYRRFSFVLDTILEPRLVIIDAGLDSNILVSERSRGDDSDDTSEDDDSEKNDSSDDSDSSSSSENSSDLKCSIKVTGLREWTKAIFGDPLMSVAFSRDPSKNLIQGFRTRLEGALDDLDDVSESRSREKRAMQIRLNLYRVYHALNAISVEYIRRDGGSDPRELKARKALVEAVRELEAFEEHETSKRRLPRIEAALSKKPRTASP